jgi:hypothetical protein
VDGADVVAYLRHAPGFDEAICLLPPTARATLVEIPTRHDLAPICANGYFGARGEYRFVL